MSGVSGVSPPHDGNDHRLALAKTDSVSLRMWTRSNVGGARRDRTDDLKLAKLALSQLSYGPYPGSNSTSSDATARDALVGLERFELSTSRLSSARSNQLSYRPGKRGGRPNEERETKAAVSRKRAGSWRFIDSHMFLSTGKERNRDGLPRTSWHP
jgi:hypothetical protein